MKGRVMEVKHPTRIETLQQLKTLASMDERENAEGAECFILLSGGIRTSKTIKYYPEACDCDNDDEPEETFVYNETNYLPSGNDREGVKVHWEVFHDIDGSYEEYTTDQALEAHTNIVNALNASMLFKYA